MASELQWTAADQPTLVPIVRGAGALDLKGSHGTRSHSNRLLSEPALLILAGVGVVAVVLFLIYQRVANAAPVQDEGRDVQRRDDVRRALGSMNKKT